MGRMLDALKRIESHHREAPVPTQDGGAEGGRAHAGSSPPETATAPTLATQPSSDEGRDPLHDPPAIESILAEAEKATAQVLAEVTAELPEFSRESDATRRSTGGTCAERAELDSACEHQGELPDPLGNLAGAMLEAMVPGAPASLLFTSPDSDSLGVHLLVPLSMSLARRLHSNLLLIDTNLRRPALAARLGVKASRGLTDVLRGASRWQEVIRRTVFPGVDLLPAVPFSTPAGPLPDRLNLKQLFAETQQYYRLVLIHASSLKHPEVIPIARHCAGVYLMVRLQATTRRAAAEALPLLRNASANLLGCIVVR